MPGGWVAGSSQPSLRARRRGSRASRRLRRRPGSRRCRAPRRRPAAGHRRRRRRDLREAPTVLVGEALRGVLPGLAEIAAAPDDRAVPTRSPRRRRSCPALVVDGVVRHQLSQNGPRGSGRDGRRALEHGTPCGCRSVPACVTSPPRCRRLFEPMTTPAARFSSVAGLDQARVSIKRERVGAAPTGDRPPGDPCGHQRGHGRPRWNRTSSWLTT